MFTSKLRHASAIAAGIVLVLATTGCVRSEIDPAEPRLVVYAASSLSDVADELHSGQLINFSFAGSSSLVDQLAGGARADVLVTADQPTMDRAMQEGLVSGDPINFASNEIVLVVPAGNPAQVTGLSDSLTDTKLVICAPEVPCGSTARQVATAANYDLQPVSEESNVTDVLGKVSSGEADAGLVYSTDVQRADDVEAITIPDAADFPNSYWAAVVTDATSPAAAEEYVDFLTTPDAQRILKDRGFGPA